MTAATKERGPYLSGFCSARNPDSSHARCPGGYGDDLPCSCPCHSAPPALAISAQAAGPVTALTGVRLPPLKPGSDAWLRTMSASKIAAVVGLSPWTSRFSLWHEMAGLIEHPTGNAEQRRGHYLEPAVAQWFGDQHDGWVLTHGGSWAHPAEPLFTAAPDLIAQLPDGELRGVEIKTENDPDDWGPNGSDQIPPYYAAQIQWQMLVTGLQVTHVPMLTRYLEFREYVVHADPEDQAYLLDEARSFMASLPGGSAEQRPDIDAHGATYEAVRQLHPDIDPDLEIDVPGELGLDFLALTNQERDLKPRLTKAKAELLDVMGRARVALYAGRPIARRQPGRGGAVSLHALNPKD